MAINEIRDFPVNGFRNFIVTESGVVEVQNLPGDILRIKVIGIGSTFIYIWDSNGRKTIQIEVTGLAPNQITTFRPGYDPAGTEFIYHMIMNNQFSNGDVLSPFWTHEFSSSIPLKRNQEWRTLIRTSTHDTGLARPADYAPFSDTTSLDQFLTYYQAPKYTIAAGDINYNAGELSITGFPLRGGSVEFNSSNHRDEIQVFGGASRPHVRTAYLFTDPSENFYGVAGTKEIFPNISIKSSFVFLDQATNSLLFPGITFKDDFVADLGFQARPFTDTLTFEGEYGRSTDDNAYRVLGEYTPYWGRVMLTYRRIGQNYITPASFFFQKNFSETNFITDIKPIRKLGFTLSYQLSQLNADPILLTQKTTVHRAQVNSLYQADEQRSYLSGFSVTRSNSANTPQYTERVDFTYQRFFKASLNQLYTQFFVQHAKNYFTTQSTERFGGGADVRYTKNLSRTMQIFLQNTFQMNNVNSSFPSFGTPPEYIETLVSVGPTLNYMESKKTASFGFYENFSFRDSFEQFSNLLQPFVSGYYSLSQALSFGTRMNLNFDFTNDVNYISVTGELVYRFGTRVPDTLFSTFLPSAQITGLIFVDDNGDAEYQATEKMVAHATTQLNDQAIVPTKNGAFTYKTDAGANKITVELPEEFKNYHFSTANPVGVELFPRETKMLLFPITQRIPLHGKVVVHQTENQPVSEKDTGLEGVKIEVIGGGTKRFVETSAAGVFNTYVTKPGRYTLKVQTLDLPRGYKYIGPPVVEITVKVGQVNQIAPLVIQARRFIIGRVFLDKNNNGYFDDDEDPIPGIKVKVGSVVAESEDDGSFSISSLPAGNYTIKVMPETKSGFKAALIDNRLTVPEGGTVELLIPFQK